MRSITVLVAVLAVTPFISVTAQQRLPVKPGDLVRITAPDLGINKYTGVLGAVDRDTLTVGRTRVALASVARLDVRWGRKDHVVMGGLIGFVAGAAVGGVIGYAGGDDPPASCFMFCTAGDKARVSGVLLGGAGAVVGLIAGAFIKSDRWKEVPLERLSVSIVPQRDGRFRLGMSVSF